MTKEDIVRTAFKVWGRDLYRTMSLTLVAQELGVSKAALYRHFTDKNALLNAMYNSYFDDCAAFIKKDFDRAVSANQRESYLIMMRSFAEYYIRNWETFIFSLFQVFDRRERENVSNEFSIRGIDMRKLAPRKGGGIQYPSEFQLIVITFIFNISVFHYGRDPEAIPSDDLVRETLAQIEDHVLKGLKLDTRRMANLNYRELEKQAAATAYEDTEDNMLLRAVAGAVAEAGPWNASMEMVARRSGLSKSGLYAHFKSKQDMLSKLFITEFTRIMNFARAQVEITEIPEEQLYLGIISIVNYLRSRPEILVAMDWIKTRRLELGKGGSLRLYRIIRGIKLEAIQKQDQRTLVWMARWILFLIVNTLAWWSRDHHADSSPVGPHACKDWTKNIAEIPDESFRILFRFVALGLEGLND